ncbi:MAG: DNA integrity scanning protein DisA nucleotide-binding domain protein [Clostridia bacterium]|nr:DNA integrity scanning protein DisA nucleotide-binding domain protein [Clostridia bacterium]
MGTMLLSVANRLIGLKDGLIEFFVNFQVMYGVEIFFFFLLIYFVSKILRDNDATKLMLVYWALILVGGVFNVFAETLVTRQVFFFYVSLVSMFMLILFNVEVKKSLWDVHNSKDTLVEKLTGGSAEVRSHADTERCITNIIKALQNMSKNNVGALIVLSKGSLPKQVLQSGVEIDAEISTQMIEGIFFPKAPLHDGATIIHGHKIQAAGCFLPLTQKTSYPKEYGTRHRAAIGITEVANVISLVVSEETGIISIVKQGNVTRYADYDMLVDALKDYYWQEMPLTDKKRGGTGR